MLFSCTWSINIIIFYSLVNVSDASHWNTKKLNYQKLSENHSKIAFEHGIHKDAYLVNSNNFFLSFYDFILQLIILFLKPKAEFFRNDEVNSWIVALLIPLFCGSSKLSTCIMFNRLNSINFLHVEYEKQDKLSHWAF